MNPKQQTIRNVIYVHLIRNKSLEDIIIIIVIITLLLHYYCDFIMKSSIKKSI